ncbi:complement component receptor 1-like protein [Ciona intestinalis]
MSSLIWIAIASLLCSHLAPCEGSFSNIRWFGQGAVRVFCDAPRLLNGTHSPLKSNYSRYSVIRVTCNTGYMSQSMYSTCGGYGFYDIGLDNQPAVWNPPPSCDRVVCNAPTLRNGYYSPRRSGYSLNSVITVRCNLGYVPQNRRSTLCDAPTFLWNGYYSPRRLGYSLNSVITVTCNTGYKPRYRNSYCIRDQYPFQYVWSPSVACDRAVCDAPSLVDGNYSPRKSNYSLNSVITITCDNGYKTFGSNQSYCRGRGDVANWRPRPVCYSSVCNDPVSPDNGMAIPASVFSWQLNSTVRYECDEGFKLIGQNSSYCQASGSFAGSVPKCVRDGHRQCPLQVTYVTLQTGSRTTML